MLGDDDLGSASGAAVDAMNSIVPTLTPVAGGFAIGETSGKFSVNDSGQATYDVPIWTPEGPMGVGPSLSLHYDSSGGSGPLGVGWSLTGLPISRIERCAKTIAVDVDAGPIDLDGDTYCLDGKRLISVGGSEYRTEQDDFSKITLGPGFESGSTSFTVRRKDGLILRYGWTANARLSGLRKSTTCRNSSNVCGDQVFVGGTPPTKTLAWGVDRVSDRVNTIPNAVSNGIGNYMEVSYHQFSEEVTPRYNAGDFAFKEMLISHISYGWGSAAGVEESTRQVKFTYAKTRTDARFKFVSGLPVQETRLLTFIDVLGPNPTSRQLLRQYQFAYGAGKLSNRSILNWIKECDGTLTKCKRPTVFSWDDGLKDGYSKFKDIALDPALPVLHPYAAISVFDWGGDGKDDLLVRWAARPPEVDPNVVSYFAIYQSQFEHDGSTPNGPINPRTPHIWSNANLWNFSAQAVDIDRDGRTDMMHAFTPGWNNQAAPVGSITKYDIFRNNGNSFFTLSEPAGLPAYDKYPALIVPIFADFNGDGLPDVIEPGQFTTGNGTYHQLLFRRNQGGVLPARAVLSQNNQNFAMQVRTQFYTLNQSGKPAQYISFDGYEVNVADIDGSGRQALLTRDMFYDAQNSINASNEVRAIHLSNVPSTPVLAKYTTLQAYPKGSAWFHYIMIDANGDGLTDAVEVANSSTVLLNGVPRVTEEANNGIPDFRLNTGAGFKKYSGAHAAYPGTPFAINTREDAGIQVADLNQDGVSDMVLLGQAKQVNGHVDRSTVQVLFGATGASTYHLTKGVTANTPVTTNCTLTSCEGIPAAVPLNASNMPEGTIPARLGDFNGDGLTDIALVPWNDPQKRLHYYIREGKKADQIIAIDTGMGGHTNIAYAPVSDPSVYRRLRKPRFIPDQDNDEPWEQPVECKYPLSCLTGGMWVVKQYDVKNDKGNRSFTTMYYTEGRTDALKGWLGFSERFEHDSNTGRVTVTTYDNITKVFGQHYPYALLPKKVGSIVRDDGVEEGLVHPHRFVTTNTWEATQHSVSPKIYGVRLKESRLVETVRDHDHHSALEDLVFLDDGNYDTVQDVTTTYTYDSYQNVTNKKVRTAAGNLNETVYNVTSDPTNWVMGRVNSTQEYSTTPLGEQARRFTMFTYHGQTNLVDTETIELGAANDVKSVITYTRGPGALGQVTQKTTTATSTADDVSVPVGTQLSRAETFTYDTVGGVYPRSIKNALNQTTFFAYHPGLGVLAKTEDPNGQIKSYQYDGFGQLRKRTEPTSGDVTVTHVALPTWPSVFPLTSRVMASHAIQTSQAGGEDSIVTYNHHGRELVRQVKAGDGQYRFVLTRYTDVPGQVADVSQPIRIGDALSSTFFTHDSLGRKTQALFPDGKTVSTNYRPRTGQLGQTITTIDARGLSHDKETDDLGRVVRTTEYIGATPWSTVQEYGPFNRVKSVSPPPVVTPGIGGKSTVQVMSYDLLGRRVRLDDPDSGSHVTSYNAFGDIVKEWVGIQAEPPTYYVRDALGRVKEKRAPEGTTTFTWDTATKGIGKLHISKTPLPDQTTITYAYDSVGRASTTNWSIKGRSYTIGRQYEAAPNRRLSRIDYPVTVGTTALSVTYGYDQAGDISRVTKLNASVPYWEATRYAKDGRVDREKDATGMETTRTFNPARGWMDNILTRHPSNGTVIQNVTYLHDGNGNITDRNDISTGGSNTTEIFGYNEMNQLKTWTFKAGTTTTWTTDYAPQASGVIQQTKTGPGALSMAYNYHGSAPFTPRYPHGVQSIASGCTPNNVCYAASYDVRGNMWKTVTGLTVGYSSFDLPMTIADVNGNPAAAFAYDADNTRVWKDVTKPTGHQTTAYVSDLYERRVSPTGVVSHAMYVSNGSRVVAQEVWTQSGTSVTASPVLYLHDDVLGSTVVTNTTNTTSGLTRLRYDPFGMRINATNPTQVPTTIPTTLGYTGHEMDDEFNFINMKGRIYDAKIARFLTSDPIISDPHSVNGYDRYGYALNNPMMHTDPSGMMVPLSDQILGNLGYDRGFIDGMREWYAFGVERARGMYPIWDAERKAQRDRAENAQKSAKVAEQAATLTDHIGGKTFVITGSTAQAREATKVWLRAVLSTPRGQVVLQHIKQNPKMVGSFKISLESGVGGSRVTPEGMVVDLKDLQRGYHSFGVGVAMSMPRILAHELGHHWPMGDTPYPEDGGDGLDNIMDNENRIMIQLNNDYHIRTRTGIIGN